MIWAHLVGEGFRIDATGIAIDSENRISVQAKNDFGAITDMDHGIGVDNAPGFSSLIINYDNDGSYLWGRSIRRISGNLFPKRIAMNDYGDVYAIGHFWGSLDIDPSQNTMILQGLDPLEMSTYILKLDSSGHFLSGSTLTATGGSARGFDISIDPNENVFILGDFLGDLDLDLGPGLHELFSEASSSNKDVFIAKYNNNGLFLWGGAFQGVGQVDAYVLNSHQSGAVYAAGKYSDSLDLGIGVDYALGANGTWLVKINNDSCSVSIRFDSLRHSTCLDSAFVSAHGEGGESPYSYYWNNQMLNAIDSTFTVDSSATYSVAVADYVGCSFSTNFIIQGSTSQNNVDFSINTVNSVPRPQMPLNLMLNEENLGCVLSNGELLFVIPEGYTVISASIAPNDSLGDTLLWQVPSMFFGNPLFQPLLSLLPDTSIQLGDVIEFYSSVSTILNDIDSSNNIEIRHVVVVGSFDPNDIAVYPIGKCEENFVEKDQKLRYTIRFQNTGTAEAIDIYILDTLNPNFDIQSVRVLNNSHDPLVF